VLRACVYCMGENLNVSLARWKSRWRERVARACVYFLVGTLVCVWLAGKVDVGTLDLTVDCLYCLMGEIRIQHVLDFGLYGQQLAPTHPQVVYFLPALYGFLRKLATADVPASVTYTKSRKGGGGG